MTTYQKRVPIPEPMKEAPGLGATYWTPDILTPNHPDQWEWSGFPNEEDSMKAGLFYLTKEDAIARAKAMRMMEEDK